MRCELMQAGTRRAILQSLSVQPHSSDLIWTLRLPAVGPDDSVIRPLLKLLGLQVRTVGIWVSRIDGSAMRELGHLPERSSSSALTVYADAPDARTVVFLYEDWYWTIPID